MTNDEIQEIVAKADDEYDRLKDKVHEQYDEIKRLNNIINKLENYMIGKDIYKILLYKLRDLKESESNEC